MSKIYVIIALIHAISCYAYFQQHLALILPCFMGIFVSPPGL